MSAKNKGFAFEGLLMETAWVRCLTHSPALATERPECTFRNPSQRVTLLHWPPCWPVCEAHLHLIIKKKQKTKRGRWGVAWETNQGPSQLGLSPRGHPPPTQCPLFPSAARRAPLCWTHLTRLPSVQFSCSIASDSLWPHESQHTRPPCPSPTPQVHPN